MNELLKVLTEKVSELLKEPTRENIRYANALIECCDQISGIMAFHEKLNDVKG